MYLLRLSLRPWRIAPLSQIFSAIAVGFLLLLLGFLFWMHFGLRPVLARLQGEQVITAYLDPSLDQAGEKHLVDEIRFSLGAQAERSDLSGPTEVHLVTAPQFIESLKEHYPDLAKELDDLGPDTTRVIPRYVSVSGMLPRQSFETIQSMRGIESAESSKNRYQPIVGALQAMRWVTRVLICGMALSLLTGLIHLSRMNAYLHQDSIKLLRFWGARDLTLICPGLFSALLVGLLGGSIAAVAWLGFGMSFTHHLRSLSVVLREMPVGSPSLSLVLLMGGAVAGILSGVLGNLTSTRFNSDGNSSSEAKGGAAV